MRMCNTDGRVMSMLQHLEGRSWHIRRPSWVWREAQWHQGKAREQAKQCLRLKSDLVLYYLISMLLPLNVAPSVSNRAALALSYNMNTFGGMVDCLARGACWEPILEVSEALGQQSQEEMPWLSCNLTSEVDLWSFRRTQRKSWALCIFPSPSFCARPSLCQAGLELEEHAKVSTGWTESCWR